MYAYVHVGMGPPWDQKMVSDFMTLELKAILSYLTWVLVPKLHAGSLQKKYVPS